MFAPLLPAFARSSADFSAWGASGLALGADLDRVGPAGGATKNHALCAHQDQTPSPYGQRTVPPNVLPVFSRRWRGLDGQAQDRPGCAEPLGACRVVPAYKSSEGTGRCPSNISFSALRPAAVWPLAVTRLANRRLAARPLARALRPSPAAALRKVRPSVLRATSPIASSIRASATDPSLIIAKTAGRVIRPARLAPAYLNPAQPSLRQGFCVFLKTQKDIPCSRKS